MNQKLKTAIIALGIAIAIYASVAINIWQTQDAEECRRRGLVPVREVFTVLNLKVHCMEPKP